MNLEELYRKLPYSIKWENKVWRLEIFYAEDGEDKILNYVNDDMPCFVDLFNKHCNNGITLENNIADLLERLALLGLVYD